MTAICSLVTVASKGTGSPSFIKIMATTLAMETSTWPKTREPTITKSSIRAKHNKTNFLLNLIFITYHL